MIPDHSQTQFANISSSWFPWDSQEQYKQNLQRPYFKEEPWHTEVFYEFNHHGFRGKFIENCDILALGCSFTTGVGIPENKTWASIVGQTTNKTVTNLGVGGAGMDTVYRLAKYYIPLLQPKSVMLLVPDTIRLEILNDKQESRTACIMDDELSTISHYDIREWVTTPINNELYVERSINALAYLCLCNKIEFYYEMGFNILHNGPGSGWDIARDRAHPGIPYQEFIAEKFISRA